MLAREYCDEVGIKKKPIILSHHMLMGLLEGQAKMSKSDPNSAIFMEDSESDVNVKIKKTFCPPKVIKENPCFDYLQHIIFIKDPEFIVERKENNGGNKIYTKYEDVVVDYESGTLHPADLKPALAKAINKLLQPVRNHFLNDPNARKLLEQVKKFKVTK